MNIRTCSWQRRGAFAGLALCCALLPDPAGAAAAIEIRVERDLIAVRADDAPVREVLGLLVANGLVETEAVPALDERVTIATRPEQLAALLRRLLRPHSYELKSCASPERAPRLRFLSESGLDADVPKTRITASPVDRALAALASPDPDVREEAALALADLAGPGVAVHLISHLDDESSGVREAVETALEDLGATHLPLSGRLTAQDKD